jgi:hypothetical protein
VSTLGEFLAAVAFTIALSLGGHHYYWLGQYGSNFNPDVALDVSQVIDRMPHGLFTL